MNVRGSNRAVTEYAEELTRAEHELEMARQRVETLRAHEAGPPSPAGCCSRWEWAPDRYVSWGWQRLRTCDATWNETWGWQGCFHEHHRMDSEPVPLA